MLKKIALGLVVTASLSYGSATIFKGTSQAITIDSNPEGAKVYVDGQLRGKTPLSISMNKSLSTHTFRVVKNGYAPVTRVLEKSYDPVAILNIFWDLSTTDMLTGSAFEYSPNNYMVELEKE